MVGELRRGGERLGKANEGRYWTARRGGVCERGERSLKGVCQVRGGDGRWISGAGRQEALRV